MSVKKNTVVFRVDSRDRDRARYENAGDFRIELPLNIDRIASAELKRFYVPFTRPAIWTHNATFEVEVDWGTLNGATGEVEHAGVYQRYAVTLPGMLNPTEATMADAFRKAFADAAGPDMAAAPVETHWGTPGQLEIVAQYNSTDLAWTFFLGEFNTSSPNYVIDAQTGEAEYDYTRHVPIRLRFDGLLDAAKTWGFHDQTYSPPSGVTEPGAREFPQSGLGANTIAARRVTSPYPRDIEIDFLALHIDELPGFAGTGRATDGAFAIIGNERKASVLFDHYVTMRKGTARRDYVTAPISRISTMTIRLLDPSGEVYETRGRDLMLEFEFEVYQS